MKKTLAAILVLAGFLFCLPQVRGEVDLVTLPERDSVQVTIYNSADLTLVRESRQLILKKGDNQLQFSWANTLIDPTSLQLFPKASADKVFIRELSYPPRLKDVGFWRISSGISGPAPVEIIYFTSGLSWQAYYLATLSRDERQLDLEGYVRVDNHSGEDYGNAQVRVVVGKVHLLEEISRLARRFPPYGRPDEVQPLVGGALMEKSEMRRDFALAAQAVGAMKPKEIIKEGLSEYFLYTIEGTENIPDGWAKRLPSFQAKGIPAVNVYRYEEERYNKDVIRFLTFKNDKASSLGKEPLPDGRFKVFQQVNPAGELSYLGADSAKYIPVDQKVELNLGPARDVTVEPVLTGSKSENYLFDGDGNIIGWDDVLNWKFKVNNYRNLPSRVEIKRNFPHAYWDLTSDGAEYEKADLDTAKFTLLLPAGAGREFTCQVRFYEGNRRERR